VYEYNDYLLVRAACPDRIKSGNQVKMNRDVIVGKFNWFNFSTMLPVESEIL